jgi:hypothetical protein
VPQPFRRRRRTVRMAPSIVGEQQGFGVFIALIGTHWNQIEQSLGMMYTWLLMGQEPSAFAFYHDLVDIGLREKAFMAAARDKLSEKLIEEIAALYVDVRKLSKRRAKVIHGVWGTTPTKPQSLLLCDPRSLNEKLNEMLKYVAKIMKDPSAMEARREFPITPDTFEEWHVRDFQALMGDLIKVGQRADDLGNKVLTRSLELAKK